MKRQVLVGLGFALGLFCHNSFAVELHLYAGAGLKQPVEQVVGLFEKETGNTVTIEYGGSGQILTRFNLTKQGDLFFPGSQEYVEKLAKQNQVASQYPIVRHIPVIAVRKDKIGEIKTITDLANSSLKLGMGDAKAIALGKSGEQLIEASGQGEQLIEASGQGEQLRNKVVVRTATIKQLLMYLLNGEVDAAIIGYADAMKNQDKLVLLPIPEGSPEEIATLAVLKTSTNPTQAQQLADYFSRPEGIKAFTDYGFLPVISKP